MYKRLDRLSVSYHGQMVGRLTIENRILACFEYTDEWLSSGFSISPLSLPLEKRVFMPKADPFEGLFGVFADSLPDGWGRLLVDRLMRKKGIDPVKLGNLDRLSIVGGSGMGALTYEPEIGMMAEEGRLDYDEIAGECEKILNTEYSEKLDELFLLGGSSGGARPKIFTTIDGEDWIIKFASGTDKKDIGKQEYDYAQCAVECGIEMSEVRLFGSRQCEGYFGTKRFDRVNHGGNVERIHMASAADLLETTHRLPNLDYDILMRLTMKLTENIEECEKLFKLMCFNVYAHNRDDHSKNFSYLYREDEARWVLSPAYDLTYSNSIGGEHATTVHGNGENPGLEDILEVAKAAELDYLWARKTALDIEECVNERLRAYLRGRY